MTNDQLAADVAELRRRSYITEKAVLDMLPRESGAAYVKHLYPEPPPPKERPKIDVVEVQGVVAMFRIRCNQYQWDGTGWTHNCGIWYSWHDARAIAAALEAAGNYPEEYKEKAR